MLTRTFELIVISEVLRGSKIDVQTRHLLCCEIKQIDGFGLYFSTFAEVLKDDAWRVVSQ